MTGTVVEPPHSYIGGKRMLAKKIVPMIEATPHTLFADVFFGSGAIFYARTARTRYEIANDMSGDVSTFLRVLQRHPDALIDAIRLRAASRHEFERLKATPPQTLTDIDRAARFLYLIRGRFGSAPKNVAMKTKQVRSWFNADCLVPVLEAVAQRLAGVVIEALDFEALIAAYDRPEALFYLDPPYWGCENHYGRDLFVRDDFERLAKCLSTAQGRFLMSINDKPEVREIFGAFDIEEVSAHWPMGASRKPGNGAVTELLISRR